MYDTFDNTYQATIGIDFLSKTMYLEDRTVRKIYFYYSFFRFLKNIFLSQSENNQNSVVFVH